MQNLRTSANKGSKDAYDVHTYLTFGVVLVCLVSCWCGVGVVLVCWCGVGVLVWCWCVGGVLVWCGAGVVGGVGVPTVGEIPVREREDAPNSDISPVPVSESVDDRSEKPEETQANKNPKTKQKGNHDRTKKPV